MATERELIYDIKELLNAYSDDSKITDEHIAFMLKNTRNNILKQQMSNLKRDIPREALQTICVDLEIDEECFDDFKVAKSRLKLPATLDNTGRSDIYKVHAPGMRSIKNVNTIDYMRLPYVNSQPYNHLQLFVAVDHYDHLVAYNSHDKHIVLEKLEVQGLFEDPKTAYEMSCDYDPNVLFEDTPYPLNASLISPVKNQVLQELLTKFRVGMDPNNDAEDGQLLRPSAQQPTKEQQ